MKSIFRSTLVGLMALALLFGSPAISVQPERPLTGERTATQPLEPRLNPRRSLIPPGSLNLAFDFPRSVKASSLELASGPGGALRFARAGAPTREGYAPAATDDEFWDDQFLLGVYLSSQPSAASVYAIFASGRDIYIGGDFDRAGNIGANNIADWDRVANQWFPLGSGVNNRVRAIAVQGDDVYIGGNFTYAGGIATGPVAHWNNATHTWSAMGSQLTHSAISPEVDAIAIGPGGQVYVGGTFEKAGGLTVNNLARWDGSTWHALSSGTGGSSPEVLAIATSVNDIYIGGRFTTVGGVAHDKMARWNGSSWLGVGSGFGGSSPEVDAIAIYDSSVAVGGNFDSVTDGGGIYPAGHVALWDGSAWNTMAGGVGDPDVTALAVGQDGLYVGGRFTTLADGSTKANRIARWDGCAWNTVGATTFNLGGGVDNNVYTLSYSSAQISIYVGGYLEMAGGRAANHIARWSIPSSEWYALGNSVNGPVYALAIDGDDVYIGGSFNSAGGLAAHGIAVWHPSTHTWSSLRSGVSGCTSGLMGCLPSVYAIGIVGPNVYVGGNFSLAGDKPASRIAVWNKNASDWYALGDGVYGCTGISCSTFVQAMAPSAYYGLLVGGKFESAGGISVNNITKWNNNWQGIGAGTNGTVSALALLSPNTICVGGSFTSPDNYLALAGDDSWTGLWGGQPNGNVYALEVDGWNLYAGGAFTGLGGSNAGDHVAVYDILHYSWHALGHGLNDTVTALAYGDSNLYAGGDFTASGYTGMNHVAKFDGGNWSGLGSGVDSSVQVMAYGNSCLYIGGNFLNAGGKPSAYLGRWTKSTSYLPLVLR